MADVNEDGRDDVVMMSYPAGPGEPLPHMNDVELLLSRGDGSFDTGAPVHLDDFGYTPFTEDLDGDGHVDLAMSTYHYEGGVADIGPFLIFFGHGDGTFEAGPANVTTLAIDLEAADVNGDGFTDILTTDSNGLNVFLGNGDRTYSGPAPFTAAVDSGVFLLGDWEGDGLPDVAVLGHSGVVFLFAGHGDGTFGPKPVDALSYATLQGVATGDFNGDGRIDLAAARVDLDDVAVVLGHGDGTFEPETFYPAGIQPIALAVSDLNRDGKEDLAVRGKGSGLVSWTTNAESDLQGFNIIVLDSRGRRQINSVEIPCEQCTTGIGAAYAYLIPKHKGGHNLYIEAVLRHGEVMTFGPALKE